MDNSLTDYKHFDREKRFTVVRDGFYHLGLPGVGTITLPLHADKIYTLGFLEDQIRNHNGNQSSN